MNPTAGVRGVNARSTPRKHIADAVLATLDGATVPMSTKELSDITGFGPGEVRGILQTLFRIGSVVKVPRTDPILWELPGRSLNIPAAKPYVVRRECRSRVIDLLSSSDRPLRSAEIAQIVGAESGLVRGILLQLKRDGKVSVTSGSPSLWSRTSSKDDSEDTGGCA